MHVNMLFQSSPISYIRDTYVLNTQIHNCKQKQLVYLLCYLLAAYLYRVGSRNNAGISYGPWIGVRTLEGGVCCVRTRMHAHVHMHVTSRSCLPHLCVHECSRKLSKTAAQCVLPLQPHSSLTHVTSMATPLCVQTLFTCTLSLLPC